MRKSFTLNRSEDHCNRSTSSDDESSLTNDEQESTNSRVTDANNSKSKGETIVDEVYRPKNIRNRSESRRNYRSRFDRRESKLIREEAPRSESEISSPRVSSWKDRIESLSVKKSHNREDRDSIVDRRKRFDRNVRQRVTFAEAKYSSGEGNVRKSEVKLRDKGTPRIIEALRQHGKKHIDKEPVDDSPGPRKGTSKNSVVVLYHGELTIPSAIRSSCEIRVNRVELTRPIDTEPRLSILPCPEEDSKGIEDKNTEEEEGKEQEEEREIKESKKEEFSSSSNASCRKKVISRNQDRKKVRIRKKIASESDLGCEREDEEKKEKGFTARRNFNEKFTVRSTPTNVIVARHSKESGATIKRKSRSNRDSKQRCRPFDDPRFEPRQMARRPELERKNSLEPRSLANESHDLSYLMQHVQSYSLEETGDCKGLTETTSEEARRVFPFQATPSGNLKVIPNQVVFESKKVSVLVADPRRAKVNVKAELSRPEIDPTKTNSGENHRYSDPRSSFDHPQATQRAWSQSEGEYRPRTQPYRTRIQQGAMEEHPTIQGTSAHSMPTQDVPLSALGFNGERPIDWESVILPDKTDLYHELARRITNYKNADCIVHLGHDEFHCHLLVLQSYSTFFDEKNYKDVDLTGTTVTSRAFSIIYDWMISPTCESCHLLRRDNILEIFTAAQYLGVKELEEQCWAFIDNDELFREDTAFLLYLEARKIGLNAVMELMVPRIMKFFLMLVSTKDFLELGVEDLCSLLRSNYICVNSEMEVLMSAVRWLMHDWEDRRGYLLEVLKCVRFGLIAPWQLVDVKRNPENPEFMELVSYPEVQKMVDDGLAFVIIKYWYGNQTEGYYHWIDLLGLTEPTSRNWAGEDKNYVTYREFLLYLDEYQRTKLPELKAPRNPKMKPTPANSQPKDNSSPLVSGTRVRDYQPRNYPSTQTCASAIGPNGNNNATNPGGQRVGVSKYSASNVQPPKMPVPAYLPPGTPASMVVPPEILDEYLTSLDVNAKGDDRPRNDQREVIEIEGELGIYESFADHISADFFLEDIRDGGNHENVPDDNEVRPEFDNSQNAKGHVAFDRENLGENSKWSREETRNEVTTGRERQPDTIHPQRKQLLDNVGRKGDNDDDHLQWESSKSEEDAATVIQAVYRGYKARRRLSKLVKSASEERYRAKKVAELLAMPLVRNLHEPLEPIRVSGNFGCSTNTNRETGRLDRRKTLAANFLRGPQDPFRRNDPYGVEKTSGEPLPVKKSVRTIKSPAFSYQCDAKTESVTASENTTDTEDAFSPRIEGHSRVDLHTTRAEFERSAAYTENISKSSINRIEPKGNDAKNVVDKLPRRFGGEFAKTQRDRSPKRFEDNSPWISKRESVMIFGGIDPYEDYGSTGNTGKDIYRFKPIENTWEFVGEIPEPRHHHSVVYLKGRVYLAGGADPREDDDHKRSVVSTVWSYEPTTRVWFNEPSMTKPRKNFSLVVSRGKIFALGGQDRNGVALRSVEAFDPAERVWREMSPMFVARIAPASAEHENRIWVAGGMTRSEREPITREVECYDPSNNSWSKQTPLESPRCFATMNVMFDRIYVIGGARIASSADGTMESIGDIDILDPKTGSWRRKTSMSIARHRHATGSIGGQLLIIGGVTTICTGTLNSVECYCCERENLIKDVSTLPHAISGHGCVSLPSMRNNANF